ncbi:hypothetical protein MPSEU_000394900 [Mayamaea pseudoterrestris]|nr:hypothetical protein MPSEU_000394900 [Mayamaea pseudoterrestris]
MKKQQATAGLLYRYARFLVCLLLVFFILWNNATFSKRQAFQSGITNEPWASSKSSSTAAGNISCLLYNDAWRNLFSLTHSPRTDLPLPALNDALPPTLLMPTLPPDDNTSISDIAELYYCRVEEYRDPLSAAYANFSSWAKPLLNSSMSALMTQPKVDAELLRQEFDLELLELYAQVHNLCDYELYQYAPLLDHEAAATKLQRVNALVPSGSVRIAFSVIIHNDLKHMERLLAAMIKPWHYVVLHMERSASHELVEQAKHIADRYANVVVLQFGSIVYTTDTVSMVNLRIMRWLVQDLRLVYDYHVTMGESFYPLVRDVGQALHQEQQRTNRTVWLGAALREGKHDTWGLDFILKQKRLIYTPAKLHVRLPPQPFENIEIPPNIRASLKYKSNSGNQAIYHYSVIQKLLESVEVKQLFVMNKYSNFCCSEEHNWITALDMIGHGAEAREQAAIFQVWGGKSYICRGTMRNAFLSTMESVCYRMEDETLKEDSDGNRRSLHFHGNGTMEYLKDAKARGLIFARKFGSNDDKSMEVLRLIEEEVW